MPVRADVTARLYGVEETLAGVLVTLVDIPVLTQAQAALCFCSQIVEVLSVEGLHEFFRVSSFKGSDDLSNRPINRKLPLKQTATAVP